MSDVNVRSQVNNQYFYRFEKPINYCSRNQGNFIRPPFPPLRRRMMSNRYPNRGSRPFMRPRFRPEFSIPRGIPTGLRFQHRAPSRPFRMSPSSFYRPSVPGMPPNVNNNNRNLQDTSSPLQTLHNVEANSNSNENIHHSSSSLTSNENQGTVESIDCKSPEISNQSICDLWIETLAPCGRNYFYNARTRVTTWDPPKNVRIIELNEMNRIASSPALEQIQNSPLGQNPFVRTMPGIPYPNSFYPIPRNFIRPGLFMFPPPSTIYNPSQILATPQTDAVQVATDVKFNVTVPPPILPFSNFTSNPISNVNTGIKIRGSFVDEQENSTQEVSSRPSTDIKEFTSNENKITDWSISNSKISLFSSDNEVKEVSGEIKKADHMDNKLSCSKLENCIKNSTKEGSLSQNVFPVEKKIENVKENKKCEQIDKSRPISSTPVPGTNWCVVWTGDERVFYYDSLRKISFWERPEELLHRFVVDKLIKKPIIFLHEKHDFSWNKSDINAKKLKKDDKNVSNCSSLNEKNKNIEACEIEPEEEKQSEEEIPLEEKVKVFRELLIEKNISAASTFEKELPKLVSDSRYFLLNSIERKQVFERHILKKTHKKCLHQDDSKQQCIQFRGSMKDADVIAKTGFSNFALRHEKDVRFKAIEKIKEKATLFNQYLPETIGKGEKNEERESRLKKDFVRLLCEHKIAAKNMTWFELKKIISKDERYKAIQNEHSRENIFTEFAQKLNKDSSLSSKKADGIDSNIKNRGEIATDPVKISIHLKDHKKVQELQKHNSVISDFKALLKDLIKNSNMSWHSAKKILKENQQRNFWSCLESEVREGLFKEHIEALINEQRYLFLSLLDNIPKITLNTSWLDVRDKLLSDPRGSEFSYNERKWEGEFKKYLRKKFSKS